PYLIPRPVKKSLYVVVAGDRGLAGGYNHNVLKLAEEDMRGKNTCVVPIGKKALETLRNHGYEIFSDALPEAASVSISDSYTLSRSLCDAYLAGEVDEVFVVYTNFASMLAQTPAILRVLPLEHDPSARPSGDIPLYEPDSETVFNRIVPEYVGGILYGALRESEASEQAARRNAMDSATKNADEMIGDLSLKYNRARQGAITQEITEIVAGADA
ncbi:MAG: ATP synthase F1 subunit gamma, partial [bacterium]